MIAQLGQVIEPIMMVTPDERYTRRSIPTVGTKQQQETELWEKAMKSLDPWIEQRRKELYMDPAYMAIVKKTQEEVARHQKEGYKPKIDYRPLIAMGATVIGALLLT